MGLLDQLMSGGADADRYRDLADRFDRGAPYDGIADDEAAEHYDRLSGDLDDDTYHSSARNMARR